MTIKNIKVAYSSDQYEEIEVFDVEITKEFAAEVTKRANALARLRESLPDGNDQLIYFPTSGAVCNEGQVVAVHIASDPFEASGNEGFMFEISDSDDYVTESEWMPFRALEKERFLLLFGDDREVIEFDKDVDCAEDFEVIYADSLEDATNQLLELVADSRECFGEQEDADHIREMKS